MPSKSRQFELIGLISSSQLLHQIQPMLSEAKQDNLINNHYNHITSMESSSKQEQGWESPFTKPQLDLLFKQQLLSVTLNQERGISCSLYRQDYESLLPQRWLRTQALDLIIKLLHQTYTKQISKIYASRGIFSERDPAVYVKLVDGFVATLIMTNSDKVVLQSLAPLELFSEQTKYLIIPINTEFQQGQHWVLALLKNGNYQKTPSELYIFDSGGAGSNIGERLAQQLRQFYAVLHGQSLEVKLCLAEDVPRQKNSDDCGIFAIGFSEYVLLQIVQELEQEQGLRLNRLGSSYKYLLSNSTLARERYRKMLQAKLVESLP